MRSLMFFFLLLIILPAQPLIAGETAVDIEVNSVQQGYQLFVRGKRYRLKKPRTQVMTDGTRERLLLRDRRHRVLSTAVTHIDPGVVAREQRSWTIGGALGHSAVSDAFEDLLLSTDHFVAYAAAAYRPGPLGAELQAGGSTDRKRKKEVSATYSRSFVRLGLNYEFVPFKQGPDFFQRFHFVPILGAYTAWHWVRISAEPVAISDTTRTVGPYAAFELRFPLIVNLWLTLREQYVREKIEFDKLNFNETVDQWSTTFGGSYAW